MFSLSDFIQLGQSNQFGKNSKISPVNTSFAKDRATILRHTLHIREIPNFDIMLEQGGHTSQIFSLLRTNPRSSLRRW